jgi:hypothetical protein
MKTLYLDMDGVLVDFVGRVDQLRGWEPGTYAQLPNREKHPNYVKAWKTVGKRKFFSEAKPFHLTDWKVLMETAHENGWNVEILTSLGSYDGDLGEAAHVGKAEFLRQHYGDLIDLKVLRRFNCVATSRQKQFYATRESYLVDDYDRNTREFHDAGGRSFLYAEPNHKKLYPWLLKIAQEG